MQADGIGMKMNLVFSIRRIKREVEVDLFVGGTYSS